VINKKVINSINLIKVNRIIIIVSLIAFTSCNGQSKKTVSDSISKIQKDSINKRKAIEAQMAIGDRPDSEQETPSQSDQRKRIANGYDDNKRIDTTLISGNDTLHLHLKYYCLKNVNMIIPKSYETPPVDFVTHPYSSNVILVKGKDTVLNKEFKATDFNAFITDNFGGNLKKYGIILMPHLSKRNEDSSQIVLAYSIAIPTTDIGTGAFLIMSKEGRYKIVEHY